MKFRYVNIKNMAELLPSWSINYFDLAKCLDGMFDDYQYQRIGQYWVEAVELETGWSIRIAVVDANSPPGLAGNLLVDTSTYQIIVPLYGIIKGQPSIAGLHCVYWHSFATDVPLAYVGLTKQRWFDRLAQHESAARCGSNLIFHRALREHAEVKISHRVLLCGGSYESAMGLEEEFVDMVGLYPKGLNMIPGGFAGLRYLNTLGVAARGAAERDAAVERLIDQDIVDGRPNPLCAARWAADQDFVNRVICGHSGRLSVEEVRSIRMLSASGRDAIRIAEAMGKSYRQVANVIKGDRYARVA